MSFDHALTSTRSRGVEPIVIGRYVLSAELARGGMATVYVGRLHGDGGFRRVVAVKRLHAQFRTDDDLSTMFLDEARLAARIRHPNVVHAVDVALHDGEMFIVMEYVAGASLSQLMRAAARRSEPIPFAIVCSVVSGLLQGLHAAHDAVDEQGQPLGIVHRDVSPQNVLVGTDGVTRVLDFGVAKAVGQAHVTREGEVKGKLAYMAPEQLLGAEIGREADVFAAGTILWELLTGRRLFYGGNDGEIIRRLLEQPIPPPSSIHAAVSPELDELVLRALERDPARRFQSAAEMAAALEQAVLLASSRQVGEWVRLLEEEAILRRAALVAEIESGGSSPTPVSTTRAVVLDDAETVVADDRSRVARRMATHRRRRTVSVVIAGAALVGLGFVGSRLVGAKTSEGTASVRSESPPTPAAEAASAAPTADIVPASSPSVAVASRPSALPEAPSARPRPSVPTAGVLPAAGATKGKTATRPPAPSASAPPPSGPIYTRD